MKKLLAVLGILTLALAGCDDSPPPTDVQKSESTKVIHAYVDKETGCEYLYRDSTSGYAGKGGMTVRLDEYGKPKGCKKINE
ncbi:hypothetical protein BCP78_0090 [Bacillus phage BCP78]|uniref:DUF6440 domain-containing protein n=3 Tax=Tsarbombavirus BCP78 TaxID=1985182 RepID=J9PRB3_9CAUD|nr:hypothetical protein BCP78_0090 [Bacillus phage BCP78]YP_009783453.1 hypothetical protein QLX27_gp080 [Bacillus phage BCU4]ALA07676.1 hypothetical protein PBC6_083 [Bacillus phage PBC6]AQN32467.1 hypothetical protein BCP12_046 [Bacillus phage BCP12]AXU41189.1 hypothetical protein BC01_092 [Bacillus phage BC01]AEW47097.1 hypothetical protein BCP78_0090 [Bacillus phage BCP78]AEW47586.1 hypothetical protein BCU4_0080 [Bacillus phage BCU4]